MIISAICRYEGRIFIFPTNILINIVMKDIKIHAISVLAWNPVKKGLSSIIPVKAIIYSLVNEKIEKIIKNKINLYKSEKIHTRP